MNYNSATCIFANSMYLDGNASDGQISAEMLQITIVTRERTQESGGGGDDGVTLAVTNGLGALRQELFEFDQKTIVD